MSIAIPCPACGQRYTLQESLAGRKVRCKKCGEPIAVPSTTPSAMSADLYGLDEEEAPSPSRGLDDVIEPPPRRPSRSGPRAARRREGPALSGVSKVVLIGAGVLLVLTLIMAAIQPGIALMLGMPLVLLGIGVSIAGGLWLLAEAFRAGLVHGVLSLIVPLYVVLVAILNWREMRRPLGLLAAGLTLTLGLSFGARALTGRMKAQAARDFAAFSAAMDGIEGPTAVPAATGPDVAAPTAAELPQQRAEAAVVHRETLSALLGGAQQATSMLMALPGGPPDRARLDQLDEVGRRMAAARDRWWTLPAMSDDDRLRVREEFAGLFRPVVARLDAATVEAISRRAGPLETLQTPRNVVGEVIEVLGLPPLGRVVISPGPSPDDPTRPTAGPRVFLPNPAAGGAGGAPLPSAPPGPDEVVLRISGVSDRRAIGPLMARIRAMAHSTGGFGQADWSGDDGILTVRISEVTDPAGFADRIEFGRVNAVAGRTIEVDALP